MDKNTRNAIQRAAQSARALLEREVGQQLEGIYDIRLDGTIADEPGAHLDEAQRLTREKLVAAVNHHAALGRTRADAVGDYLRGAAFTTLNRFVALKMLEARELVQECVSAGDQSRGFKEFCGLAPGLVQLPDQGYRLYLESLFDEIGQEVGILFDRRDPSSLIWPRRQALSELLEILNGQQLASVWEDDETVGWVYQYFNSSDERKQMRDESQAPRNSRELAVRNQFFTPRYVVRFLVDNTLARTWWQMRGGHTRLAEICEFLVLDNAAELVRQKKDPRDIAILDPACGSGHFLLYAFDLLATIYEEAWEDDASPRSAATGSTLQQDYRDLHELRRALPRLILGNNLFGVDIDPRAAQIAALALWLRAQRQYREYRVPPAERPHITRTHVVVAEPMPGDEALVDAFAGDLQPPLLGDLFRRMTFEMRLAGELGTLLRVDDAIASTLTEAREKYVRQAAIPHLPGLEPKQTQEDLDFSEIDDARFFEEAEAMLLDALRRFSEFAGGGSGVRRWLFADDAAQGIAFVELSRMKFDVTLMNPPFGLPAAGAATGYVGRAYEDAVTEISVAFAQRALELAEPHGMVGAVAPRSWMLRHRLRHFRKDRLLPGLEIVLDLGSGVLDAAIEIAAFALCRDSAGNDVLAFDRRADPEREKSPLGLVQRLDKSRLSTEPSSKIIFNGGARLDPGASEHFEPDEGVAITGLRTFRDAQFLRLWWEVDPASIGEGKKWRWFARSDGYSTFYGPPILLVNWGHGGQEMQAYNFQVNGQTAQARQGSKHFGRRGVHMMWRSERMCPRLLPDGCLFSHVAPVILPHEPDDTALVLGWLASEPVRSEVEAAAHANAFTPGLIKTLPWIEPSPDVRADIAACVEKIVETKAELSASIERYPHFEEPSGMRLARSSELDVDGLGRALDLIAEREQAALACEVRRLNAVVADWLGVDPATVDTWSLEDHLSDANTSDLASSLIQYLMGVAFGRWKQAPNEPTRTLFADLASEPMPPKTHAATEERPRVLADDPGHPLDVVYHLALALESCGIERDLHSVLGADPRALVRDELFAAHLATYSAVGRKAPIYLQLGLSRGAYAIWLYWHNLTRDTLYELQNDFIIPKITHELRRLETLQQDAAAGEAGATRRELAAQEAYVAELQAFLRDVRRAAPLWNPCVDDGVAVALAPLWRLVPHKPWQRELKKKWEELCAGKYEWAQLAMHLWPERVVPKCAEDRSLAIAHGLADIFWVEEGDGKWQPREEPTVSIAELVTQRTSTAVKDALGAVA